MSGRYHIQAQGQRAELRIIGDIDWWDNSSQEFTRSMDELKRSGATELTVYVNSGGGDVFEANEIVNQIKAFPGRKIGKAGALCASAATVILRACDETSQARNGQFMIHNPWTRARGDARALRSRLQLLENIQTQMVESYRAGNALGTEEVQAMMDAETWLTAQRAAEMGLIGSVADEEGAMPTMSAELLSRYQHAPEPVLNAVSTPQETTGAQAPNTKIEMFMKEQLTEVLGLNPSTSDPKVLAAVNALKEELKQAKDELEKVRDQAATQAAEALVDAAIEQKKITANERDAWIADAKTNYGLVNRTFARIPAPTKLSAATERQAPHAGTSEDRTAWDFDTWMEKDADGLMALREKESGKYSDLYQAKFGRKPQLN